jgi:sec-independent protein translocase protein TatA
MFGLGLPEIIIILLAIGILLFGGSKIVEIARSLGRVSGEFKKGKQDIERELKAEDDVPVATSAPAEGANNDSKRV